MVKNNQAFSMIELLISISIILLFSGIAIPNYIRLSQQLKLKSNVHKLIDNIELAKKKAISSDLYDTSCSQFDGYRISLNNNNYIFSFGCAGAYQNIATYDLDTNLEVTTGTGNLDFPALGTNINITINSVRIKNNTLNQCMDFTISPIGIITINESLIDC